MQLGDKLVDWNEQFRLLLFSRSAEGYGSSPQWNSLVNTINFNTNEAGLAQQVWFSPLIFRSDNWNDSSFWQLVVLTVKHENPEMEQRKRELLEQEEHLKLQLTQLEEKLLLILGNSQGNILENQVSIIQKPVPYPDHLIGNS